MYRQIIRRSFGIIHLLFRDAPGSALRSSRFSAWRETFCVRAVILGEGCQYSRLFIPLLLWLYFNHFIPIYIYLIITNLAHAMILPHHFLLKSVSRDVMLRQINPWNWPIFPDCNSRRNSMKKWNLFIAGVVCGTLFWFIYSQLSESQKQSISNLIKQLRYLPAKLKN